MKTNYSELPDNALHELFYDVAGYDPVLYGLSRSDCVRLLSMYELNEV